jgi:hypothetical protein
VTLLVQGRELPKLGDRLLNLLAAPPPVRTPQWVIRMMRTRGPRGIDERIMEVLLNVVNDIADILGRNVGIQSTTCGRLDDRFIVSWAYGGLDVRTKQRNDTSLILGRYSARCLALLALYRTGLTGRHSLLYDQMVAAEEPAAQGAKAPTSGGRFAATCRAFELEWNGEHLLVQPRRAIARTG